jgi:hypothetical protein
MPVGYGYGVARDQRLMVFLTGLASALVLAGALCGLTEPLAYAGPLLVMLLPLLAGRFVGEDRIARLAVRVRRRARRPRTLAERPAWLPVALSVPRGGRLIACGLAVRPPPLPAA